jgi:hypothetical protein
LKVYNYHPTTKEFISETDAHIDPLESQLRGYYVPLLSAYSTKEIIIEKIEGCTLVFNGFKFINVEDHRGEIVYDKETALPMVIAEIGPISEAFTELEPCEYPKWDGAQWITDPDKQAATEKVLETQATEALIQAKMREQAIAVLKEEGKLTEDGKVAFESQEIKAT